MVVVVVVCALGCGRVRRVWSYVVECGRVCSYLGGTCVVRVVGYLGGVLEALHVGVCDVLAAGGGGGGGEVPQRGGRVPGRVQHQHLRLRAARAQRHRALLHHLAQLHYTQHKYN